MKSVAYPQASRKAYDTGQQHGAIQKEKALAEASTFEKVLMSIFYIR